jgi:DnaJ-class molecular chaperone
MTVRWIPCPKCKGQPYGEDGEACPECDGKGEIPVDDEEEEPTVILD